MPREQSFEELRLHHYELASTGNQQQAIQEAQALVINAEQQIQTAVNDIDGAVKYLIEGEKQHPNRIDICKAKGSNPSKGFTSQNNSQPSTAFGSTTAFGKPSVPTGPRAGNAAFGAPAFGQTTAPGTGFGKPAFGQSSNPASAFGKPAFGQPAGTASAFGTPSALGQKAPAFGQQASASGQQTSAFGKALPSSQQSNPFSQNASNGQQSTFGRPATSFGHPANSAQAIGPNSTSTFGLPPNPTPGQSTTTSPFGKPAFGTAASQPNPFASNAKATQPNVFGRNAPTSSNNAFGPSSQPTSTSSAFAEPSMSTASPSTMGSNQKENQPFAPPTSEPITLGQTNQSATNVAPAKPLEATPRKPKIPATKDRQGKLLTWNEKHVTYVDDEPCFKGKSGAWEKIWFPDGPPVFNKTPDVNPEEYDEETKENYRHMMEHGEFKDGVMPLMPPSRQFCNWDF